MYPELFDNKYKRGTQRMAGWNYHWEAVYFITICTEQKEHFFGEVSEGEMILNEIGQIAWDEWFKTEEIRKDMDLELFDFVIMPNHMHAIVKIGWNQYNTQIVDPNNSNNPGSCAMHRAATMNDGAATMNDGAATMNDGAATMNDGAATMNDGAATMNDRAATMNDGAATMNDGAATMNDGAATMNDGAATMNDGKKNNDIFPSEIPDQLEDLITMKKATNKFGPQSKNLASVIRGYKSAVTTQARIKGHKSFKWQSRFYECIVRDERAFKNIQKYINNNPRKWDREIN